MDLTSVPIKSPFCRLDEITGGFFSSNLIIIGSRPSVGKTSFILASIKEMCLKKTAKPVFFSIEMSEKAFRQRLLAMISGMPLKDIREGKVKDNEEFHQVESLISDGTLLIDDSPSLTVIELFDRATYCVYEENCNIIFIDSLEQIRTEEGKIPVQDQTYIITKELKTLARKLNVPVVCTCRLSKRDMKEYSLCDAESVLEDSDVSILITSANESLERRHCRRCEFVVVKNRHGTLGKVDADFYFSNCVFVENQRTFDVISILDDKSVQKLLKKINSEDLVKAMKNTTETVREKIFSNQTKYSKEMLMEDIEFMGTIPVEDANNAQKRILEVLRKLEDEGEIIMPSKVPSGVILVE